MEEKVILVNEDDMETGVEEKIKAHKEGKLHRAFSIFIFNAEGKLLMQKRSQGKYHSAGLWSNTVCGHPIPGESINDAAHRRLKEEMGFVVKLFRAFNLIYNVDVGNGLVFHFFSH